MRKTTAKAPVNIALVKYWGKKDEENIIPHNDSVSLSLSALWTETTIERNPKGKLEMRINGEPVDDHTMKRVQRVLKHFDTELKTPLLITSTNNVPTAAGLASSASGFAALAKAADGFFDTKMDIQRLAGVARQGSGSACRSLLGGFVHWAKDGRIERLFENTTDLAMVIVLIDRRRKPLSSTEAMARSVKTSPYYETWVKKADKDTVALKDALKSGDHEAIGEITESNALAMHATTITATPPFSFLTDRSMRVIDLVRRERDKNHFAYATMDAGPNVKILTRKKETDHLITVLKKAGFDDFIVSGIDSEGTVIINA